VQTTTNALTIVGAFKVHINHRCLGVFVNPNIFKVQREPVKENEIMETCVSLMTAAAVL